ASSSVCRRASVQPIRAATTTQVVARAASTRPTSFRRMEPPFLRDDCPNTATRKIFSYRRLYCPLMTRGLMLEPCRGTRGGRMPPGEVPMSSGFFYVLQDEARILFVDDDPILRAFAQVNLATPTTEVDLAEDGAA